MKRNRNGISLFLKRKIAFFETENHWPYKWMKTLHTLWATYMFEILISTFDKQSQ